MSKIGFFNFTGSENVNIKLHFFAVPVSSAKLFRETHCVKKVRIRSYSDSHFPAFGLNLSVFGPNAGKCGPE